MRKILSLILLMVCTINLSAQTEPNRILITDITGATRGQVVSNIDSITFATVPENIKAEVEYKKFATGESGDTLWIRVKMTDGCRAFRIGVLPKPRADQLITDLHAANYLESTGSQPYFEDFENGQMTGIELNDASEYAIITVGYDEYGIGSQMSRADFKTPAKPFEGNADVKIEVTEVTTDRFTVNFKPSADVVEYSALAMEKGQLQAQYEMFGPMFGFSSITEMIYSWGVRYQSEGTYTWKDMTPDTDYEIFVVPVDVKGTKGDYILENVKTKVLGGDGLAEIQIEIGEFGGDQAGGYYQYVTYTPNDQTAVHRDIIINKEIFEKEWGEDRVKEFLMTDIPEDPYWNQYGVDVAQWSVDANTNYIAFSYGKNAKGEWGTLARKEFSTPAASNAPRKAKAVPARKAGAQKAVQTITPEMFKAMMKNMKKNNVPTLTK